MSCDRHLKEGCRFDVSSAVAPTCRSIGGERPLWVGADNYCCLWVATAYGSDGIFGKQGAQWFYI
jgi:hypothetical protein